MFTVSGVMYVDDDGKLLRVIPLGLSKVDTNSPTPGEQATRHLLKRKSAISQATWMPSKESKITW